MIENVGFSLYSVGATIGRPSGLWLNHRFDVCFLYGKSLVDRLNSGKTNGQIFSDYRRQFAARPYRDKIKHLTDELLNNANQITKFYD